MVLDRFYGLIRSSDAMVMIPLWKGSISEATGVVWFRFRNTCDAGAAQGNVISPEVVGS